jgi:hypothetical protein
MLLFAVRGSEVEPQIYKQLRCNYMLIFFTLVSFSLIHQDIP